MDWRGQRDAALMMLEGEGRRAEDRVAAAVSLYELAAEDDARWPEFAAVLPRLLSDKHVQVRRMGVAMAALVLPAEESEAVLVSRLADEASEVRMEAAGQLADMARPSIRASLAAMLDDADFLVRFEAARGIAAVHHSAGLDVLIEALDKDALRFRALGSLAELGDVRALPAVQKTFGRWFLSPFERTQAAGAMVRLGDGGGAAHLMARTKKKWSADRALAIELIGEVKVAGALERLSEILKDVKDTGRGAAARGLGRLGDARALPLLAAVLEEAGAPDDLKLDAAEGLIRLKAPEARSLVERAVQTLSSREAKEEMSGMLEETP